LLLAGVHLNLKSLPAVLLLLFVSATSSAAGVEFSADIVSLDASGARVGAAGKLYVAGGKVRIEASDITAGYFLIDGGALFVRPAQQSFTDARQSSRLTRMFIPVDAANACPQWRAAATNAGIAGADSAWQCERVGTALVDGRTTVETQVTSPVPDAGQRWIDTNLGIPVRVRMGDGAVYALDNIRLGTQPVELFTIPSGYRRVDPRALVERIKKSDVWVEAPR
jgi:hypothetical protein